jgi:acetyl-CoA synthetase/medium-chain acyl-CoA synthetase
MPLLRRKSRDADMPKAGPYAPGWDVPARFNFTRDVVEAIAIDPLKAAMTFVDREGIVDRRTFHEIAGDAARWAHLMRTRLDRGDRVVFAIGNVPSWQAGMLGAIKSGLVAVPCPHVLRARDLAFRVRNSGARLVVADRSLELEIEEMRHQVGGSVSVLFLDEALDELRRYMPVAPTEDTSAGETALILYTSGTDKEPKGVVHTHAYTWAQRSQATHWLDAHEGDVVWCTSEPGWAKGIWDSLIGPWSHGAEIVVHDGQFDAKERLALVQRLGVTILSQTPTEYRMLAKLEKLEFTHLPRLRHAVSVGEPLNPEVIARFQDALGLTVHDGYGQTENSLLIANSPGVPIRPGSMGLPTPGHDVAVIDDLGQVCPPGVEGDLALIGRPPTLFSGYWDAPDDTDAVFRGDWYLTGDRATRDEDGYFWFVGRADDVIVSAAYRISPFEVESALLEHPAVAESAVVGVPDLDRGQIVKAFVVLRPGQEPTDRLATELQEHVKAVTAPYNAPREVAFLDELPKTTSGKIQRSELRRLHAELAAAPPASLTVVPDPDAPDPAAVEEAERERRDAERAARAEAVERTRLAAAAAAARAAQQTKDRVHAVPDQEEQADEAAEAAAAAAAAAEQARFEAEEQTRAEAEAAEKQARIEAEEQARADAEEAARLEAEAAERARVEAEAEAERLVAEEAAAEQARAEAEAAERARAEAEEQALAEAEEAARLEEEAAERARAEAEAEAARLAEEAAAEQAHAEAEAAERARAEAEEQARAEAEEAARLEEEAAERARVEAEAEAARLAEEAAAEQARAEAEAAERARVEAEEQARAEAEEAARLEAEAAERARAEAEAQRLAAEEAAAEARAEAEAAERARVEAEEQARAEAEEAERREAGEREAARLEAEAAERARIEAEERARAEAEEMARRDAEETARLEQAAAAEAAALAAASAPPEEIELGEVSLEGQKESRGDARRRRRDEKEAEKRRAEEEKQQAKDAEEQRKRDEVAAKEDAKRREIEAKENAKRDAEDAKRRAVEEKEAAKRREIEAKENAKREAEDARVQAKLDAEQRKRDETAAREAEKALAKQQEEDERRRQAEEKLRAEEERKRQRAEEKARRGGGLVPRRRGKQDQHDEFDMDEDDTPVAPISDIVERLKFYSREPETDPAASNGSEGAAAEDEAAPSPTADAD